MSDDSEYDDMVVCVDCGTNAPPKESDFMLIQTGQGICKLCGGSTRLVARGQVEDLIRNRRNGKVID